MRDKDYCDMALEAIHRCGGGHMSDVTTIDTDASVRGLPESQQQLGQRTLDTS